MTDASWGNPDHATFVKRNIRLATDPSTELRVKVHRHLVAVTSHLLAGIADANLKVGTLEGHEAAVDREGRSIRLQLDPPQLALEVQAMSGYGFMPSGTLNVYSWTGTPEEALAKGAALDEAANDAPATNDATEGSTPGRPGVADAPSAKTGPSAGPETEGWYSGLPGSRDLDADSIGRDVLFVQCFLRSNSRSGRMDPATVEALLAFKQARGLPGEATMDPEAWRNIIPRLRRRVGRGDSGRLVRIAYSALIAGGWVDRMHRVETFFDGAVEREFRGWQRDHSNHVSGRLTPIDWDLLLAHPWP